LPHLDYDHNYSYKRAAEDAKRAGIKFLKLVQVETAEILSVTQLLVDKKLGIAG
jgi:hypothetical protein